MDIRQALLSPINQQRRVVVFLICVGLGLIPYVGYMVVQPFMIPLTSAVARGQAPPNLIERRSIWRLATATIRLTVLQLIIFVGVGLLAVAAVLAVDVAGALTNGVGTIVLGGVFILALLPAMVFALMVLGVSTGRFAMTNSIGDSLDLGVIFAAIRAQPLAWFLCLIVPFLAALPVSAPLWFYKPTTLSGRVAEQTLYALVAAYTIPVGMHLIGQAYRRSITSIERHQARVTSVLLEGQPRFR